MSGSLAFAGLFAASASELAKTLPDMGAGLQAQCQRLQQNPSAHACEQLAANLDGARQAVLKLREAILRANA